MKRLFLMIFISLLPALSVTAASLSARLDGAAAISPKVGDELIIDVSFDTGDISYNAIEGIFVIGQGLEVRRVLTGSSIISAWIDNPATTKTNEIRFAGIIAGGFKGTGSVFQVIASPTTAGQMSAEFQDVSIFRNDGLGTEEEANPSQLIFTASPLPPGSTNVLIASRDMLPPEPFEVYLVQDDNIADGKYVLIFEAIDKGSGIRSYEVREGKGAFQRADSPYVLENQRINEKIYVKASDHYGNERVVRVDTPHATCIGQACFSQTILILALISLFILSFIIWRKQSESFKQLSEKA